MEQGMSLNEMRAKDNKAYKGAMLNDTFIYLFR